MTEFPELATAEAMERMLEPLGEVLRVGKTFLSSHFAVLVKAKAPIKVQDWSDDLHDREAAYINSDTCRITCAPASMFSPLPYDGQELLGFTIDLTLDSRWNGPKEGHTAERYVDRIRAMAEKMAKHGVAYHFRGSYSPYDARNAVRA